MSAIPSTTKRRPRPPRRRSARLQRKQTRLAWLMLSPALALVALVALYPLAQTIYDSFTNRQFLEGIEPTEFVGLQNYRDLLDDTIFRDSVVVTVKFTVDHGRHRARARPDHRARRQLGLQGTGRDARDDARALGDPHRGRCADVEVDVRRRLRRHQRRAPATAPRGRAGRVDLPEQHGARVGRGRRHLEDDAVRRAAPPRRPPGDPERALRGCGRRRREQVAPVLEGSPCPC